MSATIVIEVVLAIGILFVANSFWQLVKRDNFLKKIIRSKPLLEEVIPRSALHKSDPKIAAYAEKTQLGYALNIPLVVEADRKTIKRLQIIFGLIGIIVAAGSYAFGLIYLILNCTFFAIPAFFPITQSAQRSAIDHVIEIAVILFHWRSEDSMQCDDFANKSVLRTLNDVIKNVYQENGKGPRAALEVVDQSINCLRLGIFSYLQKKYVPVFGKEDAKFWAVAVLNAIIVEEPGNEQAKAFYRKNKDKILKEALNVRNDNELATAASYLYAAQTIYLAGLTKAPLSQRAQELGEQATRLGIYIPNTYEICGSNDISTCINSIDSFAKEFVNKNAKGAA
jgi:hypothetical protein